MDPNKEYIVHDVTIVAETSMGLLLRRDTDDEGDEVWFPKSQIDWDEVEDWPKHLDLSGNVTTFYIPGWLMMDKGWEV